MEREKEEMAEAMQAREEEFEDEIQRMGTSLSQLEDQNRILKKGISIQQSKQQQLENECQQLADQCDQLTHEVHSLERENFRLNMALNGQNIVSHRDYNYEDDEQYDGGGGGGFWPGMGGPPAVY